VAIGSRIPSLERRGELHFMSYEPEY